MGIHKAYKTSGGCKPKYKCKGCRYYQPIYEDKKVVGYDCKKYGGDGWWKDYMACRSYRKIVKYAEDKNGQLRLAI